MNIIENKIKESFPKWNFEIINFDDKTKNPCAKPLGIINIFLFSSESITPSHFPYVLLPGLKSTATSKTSPFIHLTSFA